MGELLVHPRNPHFPPDARARSFTAFAMEPKPLKTLRTFLAVLFISAASAPAAQADDKLPPAVAMAIAGGMKMEATFPAPSGMTGYLLSQGPENKVIVYVTSDGQTAIAGTMLDGAGKNLTKEQLARYAPAPDYEARWSELEKAAWVAEGARGSDVKTIIYAFEDSNCPFCHLSWKEYLPYMAKGLQVRWVPVAFEAPDSANKAALLFAANDVEAAQHRLHDHWGTKTADLPSVSETVKAKLDANFKLLAGWGVQATPITFYKDKGGKVRMVNGLASLSRLPEITGLPEIPNEDPDLQRFH